MHLDRWIREQGYGSLSQLARSTGLDYGTVYWAYKRSRKITYQNALLIEKATKGAVTAHELCTAKPLQSKRIGKKRAA